MCGDITGLVGGTWEYFRGGGYYCRVCVGFCKGRALDT